MAPDARSNSPAGDRGVRPSPGREAAVTEAVDAIVRRARLIWWQSERLREAGELVVARLIEVERAFAPEGARG